MDGKANSDDGARLIQQAACEIAFGQPILMNTLRAVVAEAIVAHALGNHWRHCSADYHAYDFERCDGVALELKQSAARQSWATGSDQPTKSTFDIAERTGRFVGRDWIVQRRRWADVYVFAHHPRTDDNADHRRPEQWNFYVLPARDLPTQASISLSRINKMTGSTTFAQLASVVDHVADITRVVPQ
ncbi:hypothetical protein [Sphingomonas sp. CFBP 13720]|uniref:hypothetical protein n=1 Tax=Sphingomonas sp. CFBP 13720 TaxID=2775302 RepID=UPI0017845434|nr:hypothetical protein [Sphingomonas sp. CFBP 13720]MBD8678319.1 hypothetical protein [Sphingomonas sp. CFBP 13720]